MVVASFIIETEDSQSIKEALSILKEWNPSWEPKFFMSDDAEEEIGALESIFPESFVFLCDFHTEQSWDCWLSASHNGVVQYKSSILEMFRNIVLSMTEEEYVTATDALQANRIWKESKGLRTWFERTWLRKHKRWVKAYRPEVFNVWCRKAEESLKECVPGYEEDKIIESASVNNPDQVPA